MLLHMDPENFSIEEKKLMGMWPPGDLTCYGLWSYIKRLKQNNLEVLEVGVQKGENVVCTLQMDTEKKIHCIWGISYDKDKTILEKNIKGLDRFQLNPPEIQFDVVMINSDIPKLSEKMSKFYKRLKPNGIFCGNNHPLEEVKVALKTFRRADKIGSPILISRNCWFWYKR